jgi:hypothetical protein
MVGLWCYRTAREHDRPDFDRPDPRGTTTADLEIHPPTSSRALRDGCRGCGSQKGCRLCYEGSDKPRLRGANTMIDQWLEYTEWPGSEGSPSQWRLEIRTAGVDVVQTLSRYETREAAHVAALQASSKHNLRVKSSD